jgi:hypothetical protein
MKTVVDVVRIESDGIRNPLPVAASKHCPADSNTILTNLTGR